MTGKPKSGLSAFLKQEFPGSSAEVQEPVTPRVSESVSSSVAESVTPKAKPSKTSKVQKVSSPKVKDSKTPKLTESKTPRVLESVTREVQGSSAEILGLEEAIPLYKRLIPKETRFREDQLEDLAKLARRLTRAKSVRGGERITENTLIRVAVDALLERGDALMGETEVDLLTRFRSILQ